MFLTKLLKQSSVVTSSVLISAALMTAPAFAQTTGGETGGSSGGGVSSVETMVGDLDGVAEDAFPIAVGVTGFAVAALLIKRVLYA